MKLHVNYGLLTDDGKPMPQGTRLINIQNEDVVMTFAGIAIDEYGQPQIQLYPDAGKGVVHLHATNAHQLRFATDLPPNEVARESVDMDNSAPSENRNFAACSDSAEDRGVRDLFYALTAYCEWRGAVLPPGIREFMDGAVKVRAMPMLVAAREALEAHRVSESDDIPF